MGIIISGIDEAGRGSVLGPLIVVGVSIERDKIEYLQQRGVKDSKLFTGVAGRKKRSELAIEIQDLAEEVKVIEISSIEIDQTLNKRPRDNLNLLELRYFSKLIQELDAVEIYVDTISSPHYSMDQISKSIHFNSDKSLFKIIETNKLESKSVLRKGELSKKVTIATKADSKYTVVAAASCIAKHVRDLRLREIEEEWNLPNLILGRGYPNEKDQSIMRFLEEYSTEIKRRSFPFIRYLWEWRYLQQIMNQPRKKLDGYF
ncbi:MAG: hypothetical protein ACW98F_10955 [Candidatus Hodarchaeales archaeon]